MSRIQQKIRRHPKRLKTQLQETKQTQNQTQIQQRCWNYQIRSDQISCSVVSDSLRPHESQQEFSDGEFKIIMIRMLKGQMGKSGPHVRTDRYTSRDGN